MLQNYLKIALRTLGKHAGYTFINVTGLAVGIACCLLILLFVRDELRYDRFHENADRIYRVRMDALLGEQEIQGPISPAPMAATLKRDFPEVLEAGRLYTFTGEALVRRGDIRFTEANFHYADSTIFRVFTLPFLKGDPETALTEPNTVVLTASTARRYFGDADPIGQVLRVNDNADFRVTGVIEDIPAQSHFHSDFIASLVTLDRSRNPMWISNNFYTYLLLPEGYDPARLEAKFPDVIRQYAGPQVEQVLGITVDQFYASGGRYGYFLQPLTDIHLHSHLDYEIEPNGDILYVYAFSAIAVLILLIACINFMNLATARSANRAKEVGVRKVLGSNRKQLTGQFLFESTLLSGIAVVLAVILAAVALPFFNDLSGKQLSLDPWSGGFLPALLGMMLLVGLLAGIYPAFFLSSFGIVNVLKGRLRTGTRSAGLRSGLVVFQFAISIALMIGTAVVFQQVRYVQTTHLGFDKEHVVVVERTRSLEPQFETFKQEALAMPGVTAAAGVSDLPGENFSDSAFLPEGAPGEETYSLRLLWVDYDALETLDLDLAAGRTFSPDFPGDSTAILLNEAAVRELGWQADPLGRRLVAPSFNAEQENEPLTVIGVVEDFHFQSLHQQIRPLAIFLGRNMNYLAVRVRPEAIPATLAALEQQWQTFAPEQPFSYAFLDNRVDGLYQADQRSGLIFGIFAGLAILIACLGLFGLAAFTAEQRTKEIGVRKVLGASVPGLIGLLSKDFLQLVGVAFVVAAPVAYFAMQAWLNGFAYRIDIPWWIFLLAGLSALGVALLTVSYQSIKASLANPVKSLRYE